MSTSQPEPIPAPSGVLAVSRSRSATSSCSQTPVEEVRFTLERQPTRGWDDSHQILQRSPQTQPMVGTTRRSCPWSSRWRPRGTDAGHTINRKRTRRLWRDEGLRRPPRCKRKRTRPPGGGPLLRAERPNHVWAIDFQFDETADRRRLKLCNIVDEHTREALAMDVGRSCTADDVVAIIERLVAERGAPEHLRMDNGPELIAWALRDWCRLHRTTTTYIEPGSPWENPFVESFNGRSPRRAVQHRRVRHAPRRPRSSIEAWRVEYNTYRPH